MRGRAKWTQNLELKIRMYYIKSRKIFTTMSRAIELCNGNLQVIVLEHANEEVWDGLENVKEVCEWRGDNNKLIPMEWVAE